MLFSYMLYAGSAKPGVAVSVLFAMWLFAVSLIPFVGLHEFVHVSVSMKSSRISLTRGRGNKSPVSNVDSSDCGTLTG
jgi:hypothetical protein